MERCVEFTASRLLLPMAKAQGQVKCCPYFLAKCPWREADVEKFTPGFPSLHLTAKAEDREHCGELEGEKSNE